jgi:hypothetical protein
LKLTYTILAGLILFFLFDCAAKKNTAKLNGGTIYCVQQLQKRMQIDANWNKKEWQKAEILSINNIMGDQPDYMPSVCAKLLYDSAHLYIIFSVKEKSLNAKVKEINGPVWQDACVEFFFAPDTLFPERYFNLEINAIGVPLMHFNKVAKDSVIDLAVEDIKKITIAHSFIYVDEKEIQSQVKWSLEYKLPLAILEKYATITKPAPGVQWKANFYKIAHLSSQPHYLSWSHVPGEVDMHLPQFFGKLGFKE